MTGDFLFVLFFDIQRILSLTFRHKKKRGTTLILLLRYRQTPYSQISIAHAGGMGV